MPLRPPAAKAVDRAGGRSQAAAGTSVAQKYGCPSPPTTDSHPHLRPHLLLHLLSGWRPAPPRPSGPSSEFGAALGRTDILSGDLAADLAALISCSRSRFTLMIDNYDSFTHNLYQYLEQLGANVRVVRNDEITIEEVEVRASTPRAAYSVDPLVRSVRADGQGRVPSSSSLSRSGRRTSTPAS
jgi:hypothetical protein